MDETMFRMDIKRSLQHIYGLKHGTAGYEGFMTPITFRVLFTAIVVMVMFCSCCHVSGPSHADYENTPDWSIVAGVAGNNHELQNVVRDDLKKKGINCIMQGSIAYDVLVPNNRLTEARKLLQEDSRLKFQKYPRFEYELLEFSK
jgi:hypothetical protein